MIRLSGHWYGRGQPLEQMPQGPLLVGQITRINCWRGRYHPTHDRHIPVAINSDGSHEASPTELEADQFRSSVITAGDDVIHLCWRTYHLQLIIVLIGPHPRATEWRLIAAKHCMSRTGALIQRVLPRLESYAPARIRAHSTAVSCSKNTFHRSAAIGVDYDSVIRLRANLSPERNLGNDTDADDYRSRRQYAPIIEQHGLNCVFAHQPLRPATEFDSDTTSTVFFSEDVRNGRRNSAAHQL
jgi:hypothetical protein